jgi:hypothetical protein
MLRMTVSYIAMDELILTMIRVSAVDGQIPRVHP